MEHIKNKLFLATVLSISLLNGCTNNHQFTTEPASKEHQEWLYSIIDYKNGLELTKTSNSIKNGSQFVISDEMRSIVLKKFSHLNKNKAAEKLARWLMDDDGHNMQYDLSADLFPIEAFNQRRGNCLSFTILLVNLANVLDIDLDYNDVHLPNLWGLASNQEPSSGQANSEKGIILFRHINAVRNNKDRTAIYDLAIEEYDYGYPQRIISEEEAMASLHSNIATKKIQEKNYTSALHHIRYAISLYPSNPDFWVNLGVVYKRSEQVNNAENAFLHALNIKDNDSLAASNLENLYREQGQTTKADYFEKLAYRVKQKNPYIHYQLAQKYVAEKRYKLAEKSIKKAQKLHRKDPRFFVLSSTIAQYNNNYVKAIKDIQHAYTLTVSAQDRTYFSKKARLLAVKAVNNSRGNDTFDSIFNNSGPFDSTNE